MRFPTKPCSRPEASSLHSNLKTLKTNTVSVFFFLCIIRIKQRYNYNMLSFMLLYSNVDDYVTKRMRLCWTRATFETPFLRTRVPILL